MANALEVAGYIIKSLPVDNLRLQKLLYYAQAVHLVRCDRMPLFLEEIEAWDYGPVVPEVYGEYKRHGLETIPSPTEESQSSLTMQEIRSVSMALGCFGEMSGPALINQTHGEPPWKNAYRPGRPSGIISTESIYDFFHATLDITEDEV